jgi:Trk K+ transport system NAD-binding subunit
VPHVVTRLYDPEKDEIMRQMGLETVCPTMLTVAKIGELLEKTEEE